MRTLFKHIAWGLATAAMIIATPLRAAASTGSPANAGPAGATAQLAASSPLTTGAGTSAIAVRTALTQSFANALPNSLARSNSATTSTGTSTTSENGAGWREAYCLACIALGTFALYTGGITMLPVILANPAAYGTFAGTCIHACEALIQQLAS